MSTFSNSLKELLTIREMSIKALASRTGIPEQRLVNAIASSTELEDEEIGVIAGELAAPIAALFSSSAPQFSKLPDFRRATPNPGLYHPGTLKALGFVEKISATFLALRHNNDLDPEVELFDGNLTKRNARKLARKWREQWGMTDQNQLELQNSNAVYVSLRGYIESLGVLVMHHSFKTDEVAGFYARIGDGPHSIAINTTASSKARKLFTLAHEFGHVLLGKTGVSDPSLIRNKTERFCNAFAAYLLAPDSLINTGLQRFRYTPSSDNDFINLFARKLGISQQACFLRLVELDYLSGAQYHGWISQFDGRAPTGDQSDGGGGRSDPIANKRTQYGSSLLRMLASAKKSGALDEIDIFRLAGIKPKYQPSLFEG